MSYRKHLLTNVNWVVSANIFVGIINFFAIAWFARRLGPTVMGNYAVVVTALQLISAFLSAGFDQAVIRDPKNSELLAAANIATTGQSILLLVISCIVYFMYYLQSPIEALQILYPAGLVFGSIVFSLYGNLFAAPIAANLNYRYLSTVRLVSTLAGVGVGIILIGLETGIYALAARDIIAALIMLFFVRAKSFNRLGWNASRFGFAQLTKFASGMWGLNLLERVALRLDYALIGILFGKEIMGMYFVVRGLVEGVLGFLVTPVQTVFYAYYCRLQDKTRIISIILKRLSFAYYGICLLLVVISFYVTPKILPLLLGVDYQGAFLIVPGLVVYAGSILWFENLKVLAMSQHKHHTMVAARLMQIGILLLSIYPLTKAFGLLGAGFASGVSALALGWFASIRYWIRSRSSDLSIII